MFETLFCTDLVLHVIVCNIKDGMSKEKNMRNYSTNKSYVNRNAIIRAREDRKGNYRTETARRDDTSVNFAVSTNPENNATMLYIDRPEGVRLRLNGREARTLYRLLSKHYMYTGKI